MKMKDLALAQVRRGERFTLDGEEQDHPKILKFKRQA